MNSYRNFFYSNVKRALVISLPGQPNKKFYGGLTKQACIIRIQFILKTRYLLSFFHNNMKLKLWNYLQKKDLPYTPGSNCLNCNSLQNISKVECANQNIVKSKMPLWFLSELSWKVPQLWFTLSQDLPRSIFLITFSSIVDSWLALIHSQNQHLRWHLFRFLFQTLV